MWTRSRVRRPQAVPGPDLRQRAIRIDDLSMWAITGWPMESNVAMVTDGFAPPAPCPRRCTRPHVPPPDPVGTNDPDLACWTPHVRKLGDVGGNGWDLADDGQPVTPSTWGCCDNARERDTGEQRATWAVRAASTCRIAAQRLRSQVERRPRRVANRLGSSSSE